MNISEASQKVTMSADTLRYYERIGLIPAVKRTKGGIRNYKQEDLEWIEFVKCMRHAGLSIEVLAEYLTLYKEGASTFETRKQLLIAERNALNERIDELLETREHLNAKIAHYENSQK
ncbi:MerR family transcriptional regulator [Listeria costaricensis]|uniref:MerR family transcriptional regulator n=1 Tax=Listeria costaricensis TaxID=2026604 RepID=UPI000C0893EA|nr:MerR family transcriptional regulator [Listeria costaricensis]